MSASVADDVIVSRGLVFGDVEGDGRRSGRKWLRRPLRGPAAANYYGLSFRDLAPNFTTAVKEDIFRYEQMLNRGGKTRITGKQKPFAKPLVDTMKFEEEIQSVSWSFVYISKTTLEIYINLPPSPLPSPSGYG